MLTVLYRFIWALGLSVVLAQHMALAQVPAQPAAQQPAPQVSAERPIAVIEEGIHYERLTAPQPTSTPGKVEVLELFWYACPHCYELEPYLDNWLHKRLPAQAQFVRMPAVFNAQWELLGRAYYTMELLGLLPQLHGKLFTALHQQKRPLFTEAALESWFIEQGVKAETFRQTFRSFAVESALTRNKALMPRYGANGVPTVIINGKYRTSPGMTGTYAGFFQVIEHLIQQELAAQATPAASSAQAPAALAQPGSAVTPP